MATSAELLELSLTPEHALPGEGALIGRAWMPAEGTAAVVGVRDGQVVDLTDEYPTITDVVNSSGAEHQQADGPVVGDLAGILRNSSHRERNRTLPWLLAPLDLQPVKASGVTFAVSLLERVIEEQAGGDKTRAEAIRADVLSIIGDDLSELVPGSAEARALKERLVATGSWSQYLEVGIGPDPEVFTKAPPMASVGTGAQVGIRRDSSWSNPEPELAIVINSRGEPVGASLANDVNLRDIEGRSALLLGTAKDNNAACAIGPFIRMFDQTFGIDDASNLVIELEVVGADGYRLTGASSLSQISRSLTDLAEHVIGPNHQYPDGVALLSGTMFAPTQDRDVPGEGFTHHVGDVVRISSPGLGTLVNEVAFCDEISPWDYGIRSLMGDLARKGALR